MRREQIVVFIGIHCVFAAFLCCSATDVTMSAAIDAGDDDASSIDERSPRPDDVDTDIGFADASSCAVGFAGSVRKTADVYWLASAVPGTRGVIYALGGCDTGRGSHAIFRILPDGRYERHCFEASRRASLAFDATRRRLIHYAEYRQLRAWFEVPRALPDGGPDWLEPDPSVLSTDSRWPEFACVAADTDGLRLVTALSSIRTDTTGRNAVAWEAGVPIAAYGSLVVGTDGTALLAGKQTNGMPIHVDSGVPAVARYARGSPALDVTFGDGGIVDIGVETGTAVQAVADSKGRALVVMTKGPSCIDAMSCERPLAIARLLPSGAMDTTFGDGGAAELDLSVGRNDAATILGAKALAHVDEADRIIIAGGAPGDLRITRVVRLTETGKLDTTWGKAGVVELPPTNGRVAGAYPLLVRETLCGRYIVFVDTLGMFQIDP